MKKWRNKITGEINEFMVHKRIEDSEDGNPVYAPFDGNIEEWEDYEEPKNHWYIDCDGEVLEPTESLCTSSQEDLISIGNYFSSREEAEKAVEKLKAWKRLKDKGFKFIGYELICGECYFKYDLKGKSEGETYKDLDTCFGGEE